MRIINIKTALTKAQFLLKETDSPFLDSELILAHVLKENRIFLKLNPLKPVRYLDYLRFWFLVLQRRKHYSVDQVIGIKSWANLSLRINKHVLVPRDETEILCQHLIHEPRGYDINSIIDLGTGSGAIAILLAKYFKKSDVYGLDISKKALRLAQKNALVNRVNVAFIEADLLTNVKLASADIVVANLPYLPLSHKSFRALRREPSVALFSGMDGLDHYCRLALQINKFSFRELWIEFLPTQKNQIGKIFKKFKTYFYVNASGQIFFAKIIKT